MTKTYESLTQVSEFSANPLYDCDPHSMDKLSREINDARVRGYNIEVYPTEDQAYNNPESIAEVYSYLRTSDIILAEKKKEVMISHLGSLGYNPFKRAMRKEKAVYKALEPLREELLFGDAETNSMPWHRQRGRAAALLTIAQAHELETPSSSGLYPTMSGMLDSSVIAHRFRSGDNGLANMTLLESVIYAETAYGGRSLVDAESIAKRRVAELEEFTTAPSSEEFKRVVQYCSDSLGIRARKEVVSDTHLSHVDYLAEQGLEPKDMLVMSFGSGTALPMLEMMLAVREKYGAAPKIILIDQDPLALAAASQLAEKTGLEDNIEIHCVRLFSKYGSPVGLKEILAGRDLHIGEDSGLREYLPDNIYKKLTNETWSNLAPGGLMTTGNMNKNRPQAEFLHGMMGWQPQVQMREIQDNFDLHEAVGVPKDAMTGRATQEGLYTMVASLKK